MLLQLAAHSTKSVQAALEFLLFWAFRLVRQNPTATIIAILIELPREGDQVQLLNDESDNQTRQSVIRRSRSHFVTTVTNPELE